MAATARAYTAGQLLILCRANRRYPVAFVSFHTDQTSPGRYCRRALVTLPDGREASTSVTTLHPLEAVTAAATPIRGMDRSGWHGFIHDDDPSTPVGLRALWRCDHAHRGEGAAIECAAAELRRWVHETPAAGSYL